MFGRDEEDFFGILCLFRQQAGLGKAPLLILRGALDRMMCWFLCVSPTTASYTRRFHWLRSQTRVMSSPDWLCNLCSMATALKVLLPDGLLDPVHLVLIPLPVPHRPLLNWNVKQLFLYLTAEYETPNNKL